MDDTTEQAKAMVMAMDLNSMSGVDQAVASVAKLLQEATRLRRELDASRCVTRIIDEERSELMRLRAVQIGGQVFQI